MPAPMNDAGGTVELPPPSSEGRTGELRGGSPCQGPRLPLTDALPLPHPRITSYVNKVAILFLLAKIYTREN